MEPIAELVVVCMVAEVSGEQRTFLVILDGSLESAKRFITEVLAKIEGVTIQGVFLSNQLTSHGVTFTSAFTWSKLYKLVAAEEDMTLEITLLLQKTYPQDDAR